MTHLSATMSGIDVSRETIERLEVYAALLEKWNKRINLVGADTLDSLEVRHFQDSAQIMALVEERPCIWADLGSGGGFPGLVIAILACGGGWTTRFDLIESDERKAAFLRTVSRETGVRVDIHADRIETIAPIGAQIVSARALAPLPRLLPLVRRHLGEGGTAFLPKGRKYQQELKEARDKYVFSLEVHPSQTDPEAVILEIGDIQDV